MAPLNNYSQVDIRVGVFIAFCLALMAVMIISFGKISPVWLESQEIQVVFENVSGLRPNAPVRYNGLEVGRVKYLTILHLSDENLERLPKFTKRDIDNLPFRPESLKRQLRSASDLDFDTLCRQALKNRTMISLGLEVVGDRKQYRLDDQIRIITTVLGDTAVEIMSGSGAINTEGSNKLILGVSGDFFSNLAKSMGDVREVLSGVTDVVGTEERKSFERSQARMGPISAKLESISKLANTRIGQTRQHIDKLSDDSVQKMNEINAMFESLRPQIEETSKNIKERFSSIQEKTNASQDESSKAFKEISDDFRAVKQDVKQVWDQSKTNFDDMRDRIHGVYDSMGGLSSKLDNMRNRAGRLIAQSEPDIARMQSALKNSLQNFRHVGQAAMENKDLMISMRDVGEYEYNTALVTYREVTNAARRLRDTGSELEEMARMLDEQSPASAQAIKALQMAANLAALRAKIEAVRDRAEETLLPEFEFKRTAWKFDAVPEK